MFIFFFGSQAPLISTNWMSALFSLFKQTESFILSACLHGSSGQQGTCLRKKKSKMLRDFLEIYKYYIK